jgi:hypothetical protein
MGSIIVTIKDLKIALKNTAKRGRVVEHTPGLLLISVPKSKLVEVEEYLRMHLPYSVRFDLKPLKIWDTFFLWTVKHRNISTFGETF